MNPFGGLKKFVRKAPPPNIERCELCNVALAPIHPQLLELETRRIACSCGACAMLFDSPEVKRFKRIPRDIRYLTDFQLTDVQWSELHVPINLAFFLDN